MEFAQTSAVLEFYIWFRFRPYHPQSTCHSAPVCVILSKLDQKKMTSCRFSGWRISAILDFRGPKMGSLKSPCTTSYRSSINTIALNSLVFEKIAFFCILVIDRQTDEQMHSIDALSRSRCRESGEWLLLMTSQHALRTVQQHYVGLMAVSTARVLLVNCSARLLHLIVIGILTRLRLKDC